MKQLKNKKIIFSIIYLFIVYGMFLFLCKKLSFVDFSIDLALLFTIFNVFVLCHVFIDIKKLYDFIYKKRYLLGIIALLNLVIGKYNGLFTARPIEALEIISNPNIAKNRMDRWIGKSPPCGIRKEKTLFFFFVSFSLIVLILP